MPGPIVSAIASLIFPDLGQILNKRYVRGVVIAVAVVVANTVMAVIILPLAMLAHLLWMLLAAIDAYRIAKSATPVT